MATQEPTPIDSGVAVVTVSYGSGKVLPAFLDSVTAASRRPLSVVIADNKPENNSDIECLARRVDATYLPLPGNRGYGAAVNAAIATLPPQIRWVLISNPDIELGPDVIDLLLDAVDTSSIGAVGPSIVTDGRVYPSARDIPSLRTGIGHALFANLWLTNPWTRAYRNDRSEDVSQRDTGWLSGACLLVRRTAFDALGGFDEGYFMYFEDVDLGYRMGLAGYRNVYVPTAVVHHLGAHSTNSASAAMVVAHHESAQRFLRMKYAGPLRWPIRAVLQFGLRVRSRITQRAVRGGGRVLP